MNLMIGKRNMELTNIDQIRSKNGIKMTSKFNNLKSLNANKVSNSIVLLDS